MIKRLFLTTSLKANILANFSGTAITAILGLIFIPIYLKYIGAEGYGLIGIFTSLQIILSVLDSGLSTTVNKELSRLSVLPATDQKMNNIVKTLGSVYWIIALVAGIIGGLASPLLARYWVQPKELSIQTITYVFILLSITTVFQFPTSFYSGGLLGLQRQVILNLIRIVYAILRSVGSVLVLIFISKSILLFFLWNLIVAVAQAFTMKYYLWHFLPKDTSKPVFDRQEIKNLWRFASGMLGISIVGILITQIDKIILSKILPLEQFGYYTIACTLGLMIYQIVMPLSFSYFPKFSSLISIKKEEDLKNIYHQASQMISVLVLPATFVLLLFSKELIFIWTKNTITTENTWMITSIYALGTGINGLMTIPYVLTLSYGWTKLGFYQNILMFLVMAPLTYFLAVKYGALGGAISWAIINVLYFLISPQFIHHRLLKNELSKWYWIDNLKPLLVSFTVVIVAKYFMSMVSITGYFLLFIIAFVGGVTVIFTMFYAPNVKNSVMQFYKSTKNKYCARY